MKKHMQVTTDVPAVAGNLAVAFVPALAGLLAAAGVSAVAGFSNVVGVPAAGSVIDTGQYFLLVMLTIVKIIFLLLEFFTGKKVSITVAPRIVKKSKWRQPP